MVKFPLAPSVSRRLASFLQSGADIAPRSSHWEYFSGLNRITVDVAGSTAIFSAGAGFDSSYELNFRQSSLYETVIHLWLNIRGANPDRLFSRAFSRLWHGNSAIDFRNAEKSLLPPLTAHKILATHYASLILPALPITANTTYVEIGPGSGYLAALIHHHRPGRLILIDLPEMLPYSFLMLHRIYPELPFLLPNELEGDPVRLPESGFIFMASDQANRLPDHCMDIGVNTASFGEMLPELVTDYFRLLRRIVRPDGLLFTCNRVEKWMEHARGSPNIGSSHPAGHWMRFGEYPWSPEDRDVFFERSKFHDLVQPENPMMQRLCHLAPFDKAAAVS
jgi:hypothetical protein